MGCLVLLVGELVDQRIGIHFHQRGKDEIAIAVGNPTDVLLNIGQIVRFVLLGILLGIILALVQKVPGDVVGGPHLTVLVHVYVYNLGLGRKLIVFYRK